LACGGAGGDGLAVDGLGLAGGAGELFVDGVSGERLSLIFKGAAFVNDDGSLRVSFDFVFKNQLHGVIGSSFLGEGLSAKGCHVGGENGVGSIGIERGRGSGAAGEGESGFCAGEAFGQVLELVAGSPLQETNGLGVELVAYPVDGDEGI